MTRAVVTMSRRGLAAAALLLATTACTSGSSTLASRFVREGTPAMDVGGPKLPTLGSAFKSVRGSTSPPAATRAPRSSATFGASALEAQSPALKRALTALALAPTPEHYLNVANAYTAEGVRDKAFDYLTEGLKLDQRDPALHDAMARTWRDWGFPDKALSAAHRATYYAPASAEVRNTLGTVLWALGQRTEAWQAWEQATVLDSGAWYAWHNLCEAALTAGRTRDATMLCQRADAERRAAKENRR